MVTTKLSPVEAAQKFVSTCKELGWSYSLKSGIVTVEKRFTPGDKVAYTECDSEAYSLLSLVPLKSGSVWGTDGGSVGGYVGLNGGYYRLNKSGESGKRFMDAVRKL